MEIGLREWLIVGAIIVILLIVIDGWRRMRAQSNSLKIDIDDKLADLGEDSYNPELPLGTARVFKPQDGESIEQPVHNKQAPLDQAKLEKAQQVHNNSSEQTPAPEEDPLMAPAINAKPVLSVTPENVNTEPSTPESVTPQNALLDTQDQKLTENLDNEIVSRPRAVSPEVLPEPAQERIEPNTSNVAFSIDTKSSQVNDNDIGFSALDSISNDETTSEQATTEEPLQEILEATAEEHIEVGITESSSAIDSFTVPDILKKQPAFDIGVDSGKVTQAEQIRSSVSDQSLSSEEAQGSSEDESNSNDEPSAEQIVSELTAQLDTDLNTNLAAATDNTDSIVNNLLNTRALSKQDVFDEAEQQLAQSSEVEVSSGYDNDEIPTESVLRRQEAVEAQAPSRSQINLGPDKFETLLAEREKDGFLAQQTDSDLNTAETNQPFANSATESHFDDENSKQETEIEEHDYHLDDEESAHNLIPNPFQRQAVVANDVDSSDELQQSKLAEAHSAPVVLDPQSEIEALKARLKALAPDEYEALEETASALSQSEPEKASSDDEHDIESPIGQRSENFDQIIAELDQQIEDQSIANQAIGEQQIDQLSDALSQVTSEVTTVIDDDVNLEDIDDSISHLSQVEALDDSMPACAKIEEIDNDSIENLAVDQLEVAPLADPLMDGFKDESNANDLMAQFEHDLQLDQQVVSNELDRPISEILRTQKTQIEESPSYQVDEHEEDALLSQPSENALSESLLLGESFDDQDEDDFNSQSLSQENQQHEDGIDHTNDLGFSAFEEDYVASVSSSPINNHNSDDPLMAGFEEPIDSYSEETAHSDDEDLSAQKSLFNDNELEAESAAAKVTKSVKKPRKAITNVDDPNVVLIVTVVAKDQYLNGAALRRVVEACGMEFGDMAVFHRFEDGADQGAVQFSMANAINPGIFDIENMDDTATPGVSFFMSMDEPLDPKNALECMMATAETVATHLNGDLLDDDRSVLRPQTKEHYRERVRIHEMNKLRQRAL
jgi:cell division protein ZipA